MPWSAHTVLQRRIEFIHLAVQPETNMSELCQRFTISRKTGYKWLARYRADLSSVSSSVSSTETLADRSRRPQHSPKRSTEEIETAVITLRTAYRAWGGRKIAHVLWRDQQLSVAPSTVTSILHRHGLISPAASQAATAWQRFEHAAPNDLWQMDFKGHFLAHETRCHPLTVMDDHSRYNLVLRACADEQRQTVQAHLTEAFACYGLPWRINTDNGPPWGHGGQGRYTVLAVWLMRLGIALSYSRPAHPQTNGKEERFHRTLKAEVLQQPFGGWEEIQPRFDRWRTIYNQVRPHEALAMQTPVQRYRVSPRVLPSTLPPIEYAAGDEVRKVQHGGWLSFRGRSFRVGQAFVGEPMALRPDATVDGIFEVYFCQQLVDTLDIRSNV
jgi:transposase InsO family protein